MAVLIDSRPAAPRWADLAEKEEEDDDRCDYDFLLPPKQVIGPDENGVKKVIEYKFNDDGNRVKVTTTTCVRKVANARLNSRPLERRSWVKFCDNSESTTVVSNEDISLERPTAPGFTAEDSSASENPLAQASKVAAVLMVCRICQKKSDHWTAKCPYKDLSQPSEPYVVNPNPADSSASSSAAGPSKGVYVPPTLRHGVPRPTSSADKRRRNDENSVRVSNLSEDTDEPNLRELFSLFGNVSRVYVAKDQRTGLSRGYGFVNFVSREDGERAIAKLNGYGYDNLILNVEWAAPREH